MSTHNPLTPEQVEQWKDFAFRMAKSCYGKSDRPSIDWIVSEIQSVFDEIGEDACWYISWDQVMPYPEGHKYYGFRQGRYRNHPSYLCDLVSEMVEDGVYSHPYRHATPEQAVRLDDLWDGGEEKIEEYEALKEEIADEWASPVHCCIRAGIDMVGEQSAGVVGFEVADLLEMYPEGLPKWLTEKWDADLRTLPAETPILL